MAVTTGLVELAAEDGATRCHVRVFPRPRRPVVLVSELPDNDGLSVALNFERIVRHVERHASVPLSGALWLERWPGRSLAALVLHDEVVADLHLRWRAGESWQRLPLTADAAALILFPDWRST